MHASATTRVDRWSRPLRLRFSARSPIVRLPTLVGGGASDADFEVPLRVGYNLGIAGMVGRFNRYDSAADCRIVFANIFSEFDFCAGWSKDQDFASIADGVQYLLQKFMAFMNMTAAHRSGLVMNMSRRHVRMKDDLIETGKAEVEDPGLQMVDPDDRVKMMLHYLDPFVGELYRLFQLSFFGGVKGVRPMIWWARIDCAPDVRWPRTNEKLRHPTFVHLMQVKSQIVREIPRIDPHRHLAGLACSSLL